MAQIKVLKLLSGEVTEHNSSSDDVTFNSINDMKGRHDHNQSGSSVSWVITHNLGKRPIVQVYNDSWSQLIPDDITHDSVNQVTITLAIAQTGNVILIA